jgi:prepilin-type N-terminal cleavage/methylation domain-containing protein
MARSRGPDCAGVVEETTNFDYREAMEWASRLLLKDGVMKNTFKSRSGFTLVEIMIVVAIIALLASMAVPNFLRARKRSQATRILEDLRMLDSAQDEYAIENNKTSGMHPVIGDLKAYLKTGSVLYTTGADIFGDSYGPFTVDSIPKVPTSAYATLSDVAPSTFWSPYY